MTGNSTFPDTIIHNDDNPYKKFLSKWYDGIGIYSPSKTIALKIVLPYYSCIEELEEHVIVDSSYTKVSFLPELFWRD